MFGRSRKPKRIEFLCFIALMSICVFFSSLVFSEQTSEKKDSSSSFSRPSLLRSSPKKVTENALKVDLNEKNKKLDSKTSKEIAKKASKKIVKKSSKKTSKKISKKPNKKATKKNDSFAVKMLPISYGDWVLDVKNMHSPDKKQCVAVNSVSVIDDGHSGSSIVVEVTSSAIRIYTESIVDVSYLDMGIAVDKFDRVDIDSTFSDTNVVFNFHVDQLIAQMRKGDKAVLTLGFWPSWPMTHTYSTDISLSGFSKVINKLNTCEEKIT